jgi:hypothetical protein
MKHRRLLFVPLAAGTMLLLSATLSRAVQTTGGTLLRDAKVDIVAEEKVIGFIKVPQGTRVIVVSTNAAGDLLIKRTEADKPFVVPLDAVSVETPAATPTPSPTPTTDATPAPTSTPETSHAQDLNPLPASTSASTVVAEGAKDPTAQEVNKALGIPLFGTGKLWEENPATLAGRLDWPRESKTTFETSFRRYPDTSNAETKVLGIRALSLFLQGTAERTSRVSILFANKGDISIYKSPQEAALQKENQPLKVTDRMMRNFQEAMRTELSTLRDALTALFGNFRVVSLGRFMTMREQAMRWDWKGSSFLLVHQPNEYLMLRILPTKELDDEDSSKKAFSAAKQELSKRVKRRPNGDVIILDLPMVNQGCKGYCVPATFERLLRYYGIPADMNILAMAGKTAAGGGTSISDLEQATYSVIADAGGAIHPRNFSGSIQEIKPLIDAGKPLIFAHYSTEEFNNRVNERMMHRKPDTNWDDWATKFLPDFKKMNHTPLKPDPRYGHVCLIIGYNEKTREIAITDSWGTAAERPRWMTEEEARQIMRPSAGLSVIE